MNKKIFMVVVSYLVINSPAEFEDILGRVLVRRGSTLALELFTACSKQQSFSRFLTQSPFYSHHGSHNLI